MVVMEETTSEGFLAEAASVSGLYYKHPAQSWERCNAGGGGKCQDATLKTRLVTFEHGHHAL